MNTFIANLIFVSVTVLLILLLWHWDTELKKKPGEKR